MKDSVSNDQNRQMRMGQHLRSNASEHEFFQPMPTVRPYYDKVSTNRGDRFQNTAINRMGCNDDVLTLIPAASSTSAAPLSASLPLVVAAPRYCA